MVVMYCCSVLFMVVCFLMFVYCCRWLSVLRNYALNDFDNSNNNTVDIVIVVVIVILRWLFTVVCLNFCLQQVVRLCVC